MMAKSLRDLIDHLLEEVSLCGDRGASVADVLRFLDEFYEAPSHRTRSLAPSEQPDEPETEGAKAVPSLDRGFKCKVWTWLTRHPEVSVGKDREGNSLTLDEIQSRCTPEPAAAVHAEVAGGAGSPVPAEMVPVDPQIMAKSAEAEAEARTETETQKSFRVFVTEERMWLAITGHGPDHARVPAFEFPLLSIIASRKGCGIAQTDLTRLSGQDKRSLPKRTDELARKGYIVKKVVQYRSNRTSWCTLRKFAGTTDRDEVNPQEGFFNLDAFIDRLINCLKEFKIISRADLRKKLITPGMSKSQSKLLTRVIRRLEAIACIRSVMALSQYSEITRKRYLSVKFIREPTEAERQTLFDDARLNGGPPGDQDDAENSEAEDELVDDSTIDGGRETTEAIHLVERLIPQWIPGTRLPNLIIKAVDQSGLKGMNNIEIAASTLGPFLRKPVETLLMRLVDQRLAFYCHTLRHLTLVRDSAVRGTTSFYIQYSLRNFASLVREGRAAWEAVDSGKKGEILQYLLESQYNYDEYGFVQSDGPPGLVNGGNATLRHCLEAVKPRGYIANVRDPVAVRNSDGTYRVKLRVHDASGGRERLSITAGLPGDRSESPAARKRKRTDDQGDASGDEETPLQAPKRRKKKPDNETLYAGMSDKERLKAQGFDETWTEYSVLCLERPTPGLYLTPFGKRRPVGLARGRPRKSRIAVFKLPRLKDYDWSAQPQPRDANSTNATTSLSEAREASGAEGLETGSPHPEITERRSTRVADTTSPNLQEASAEPRDEMDIDADNIADLTTSTRAPESATLVPSQDVVGQPDKSPPRRRGRPPKKKKTTHAAGEEKPRESPGRDPSVPAQEGSRQADDATSTPRRRGRPPKKRKTQETPPASPDRSHAAPSEELNGEADQPTPRRSGRRSAKRQKLAQDHESEHDAEAHGEHASPQPVEEPQFLAAENHEVQQIHTVPIDESRDKVEKPTPRRRSGPKKGRNRPRTETPEAEVPIEPRSPPMVDILEPTAVDQSEPAQQGTILEPIQIHTPRSQTPSTQLPSVETEVARPAVSAPGEVSPKDKEQAPTEEAEPPRLVDSFMAHPPAQYDNTDTGTQAISVQSPTSAAQDASASEQSLSVVRRSPTYEVSEADAESRQGSTPVKLERPSEAPTASQGTKSRTKKLAFKGGFVAHLRRKIVRDLVEKCGGVFPSGNELWRPFTEEWNKSYKERPDMKTIRTAVRALVELGEIRQHTFAGKNSAGVIVTKSLIADRSLEPNDPKILGLQKAMLEADPGSLYYPPGVEPDPELRRSAGKSQPLRAATPAPEDDLMVTLHETPISVQRREEKHMLRQQRPPRLRSLKNRTRRPRREPVEVTYLGSLTFPVVPVPPSDLPVDPSLITWQLWPKEPAGFGRLRPLPKGLKLLMNADQVFHAATGTFGTLPHGSARRALAKLRPALPWLKPAVPREVMPPRSLQSVLSSFRQPDGYERLDLGDDAMRFFEEVDAVGEWEMENGGISDTGVEGEARYINHGIHGRFETAPMDTAPQFMPPLAEPRAGRQKLPDQRLTRHPRQTRQTRQARQTAPRRISQLQEPATEPTTDKINEVTKEDRRRRNRGGLPTDRDTTQKLMFAMAVVRVLAGGSDGKLIDWPIVGLIFPGYPIKAISDRGRTILNRHRHVIAKIQLDFQERFADAYERDEIPLPPIDYDNLEAYDWQKIVEWAEEQIDKPKVDRTPSLPATRAQFDSVFELRTERSRNVDDIYQQGLNFTTPKTQTLLSSAPFGIPLGQGPSKEDKSARDQYLDQLSIVKSWVRANIVTPEESYRSADARQTLERFGEALIDQAIQSLVTEQAIMMGNRGRITPGRNFDITDQFIGALARRRHIETTQLRRAAHFKLNVLDPAFRSDGKYTVQQNAEDGDVMAILNLMERGRIVMCPVDPPRSRFGLVHRGYLTRLMDKTKLKFAIEVKPVEEEENYIYSDPMQEAVTNTPVPRGEVDVDEHLPNSPGLGRIPLWFDVHRQFVKVLWDTIMAAVLGYVALRPGISAEGVARGLQPCITAWEADLILRWLGDVGATQRVRDVDNYPSGVAVGWRVKEWWWMTLK